jgi:hypothetical protein
MKRGLTFEAIDAPHGILSLGDLQDDPVAYISSMCFLVEVSREGAVKVCKAESFYLYLLIAVPGETT